MTVASKGKSPETLPVLIVGAGIGGLAVALALARHGYRSLVLERAPQLSEVGAGIQLGPNAFAVFDYLGIGSEARGVAVFIDSLKLCDAVSGETVVEIPLQEKFRRRFGNPYAVLHRGQLHGVLLDAARGNDLIEIRPNAGVRDYEQEGASVVALLEKRPGTSERRGAGGLRRALVEHPPTYRRRRRAARVRSFHLQSGYSQGRHAGGVANQRGDAMGRTEVPHRPLSAVGLETVQPGRDLPQRGAGARGRAFRSKPAKSGAVFKR